MKINRVNKLLLVTFGLAISQTVLSDSRNELFTSDIQLNPAIQKEFETQKVDIAKKVEHRAELYNSKKANQDLNEIVIQRAGASFIKVHFGQFKLPANAYIEVSNVTGTEVYRYAKDKKSAFTFDALQGENGTDSFSAMSISGDTAIVRLIGKNANFNPKLHSAVVDSFMQGFTDLEIEEAMNKAKAGDVTIESTCGVNERQDVACWENSHPVEFERSRPVARILVNGSSLCTAWRVGADNHMFTNEHCVATQSGIANTEVWFDYQRASCASGNPNAGTKVSGNTLLASDVTLDYTLFTVNNFSTIQSFGHFGLDVREASLQETIYIPQHGSGNPKELAIESDQNSSGMCEIDDVSATGRAANTDMGYFCDTIGGSSGSPVLARSSNNVIALHHFGGCTNQGVKIVRIWPEVSSFFGGNVPVGDNGGSGNSSPTASFNFSCNLTSCSFDGSASSDSDGTITNYDWDFGEGGTASGASVNYNFASSGNFNVTLTVTDDEGASGSSTQNVFVDDGNSPPAAPSNLTADVTKQGKGKKATIISVDLNWNDNSGNETGFTVERCKETGKGRNKACNFSVLDTVGADVSDYSDTSATSGTYKYRVKANGNGGSGYSNTVKI